MGRTIGSKNGTGSSSKHVSSKAFLNGRKNSGGSHKLNLPGKLNGSGSTFGSCCSETLIDRSQTNFPFDIRINGFSSLLNTVKKANAQVKKLILHECDIILECRVCRNLFRSLPNYLTHKQSFCKNEFNPLANTGFSQFVQNSSNSYEFQYHLDDSLLDSLRSPIKTSSHSNHEDDSSKNIPDAETPTNNVIPNCKNDKVSRLHDIITRIAPEIENATRTPSSLYSDIVMCKNLDKVIPLETDQDRNCTNTSGVEKVHLRIESVDQQEPRSGIVFQKKVGYDPSSCDVSAIHADKRKIVQPNSAVLGPDGKIICIGDSEAVEQILNKVVAQVEEIQDEQQRQQMELNCPECLTLFPTRKTLRMHVRAAHRGNPEQEEEQSTAENKVPTDSDSKEDSPVENCEESLAHVLLTEVPCSSPPNKKSKQESLTENKDLQNSPALIMPKSLSPAKPSSNLISTIQPPSLSPSKLLILKDSRSLFSTSPKRPRGRPKKNSMLSNKKSDSTIIVSQGVEPSTTHTRVRERNVTTNHLSSATVNYPFVNNYSSYVQQRNRQQSPSPATIFTCGKCSSKFGTKSEISMHLAQCAGVINYAFLRRPKSPQHKKIGIQIRRDYLKPEVSSAAKSTDLEEASVTNVEPIVHNNYNSVNRNANTKFGWTRWDTSESKTVPSSVSSNNKSLTLEECIEIAKIKFYSTTAPNISNRSSFNNLSNKHVTYDDLEAGIADDENDEDDDEENDDRSERERNSGSGSDNENSDDDGLPDEDEKNSNHEIEMDTETDRDSNVTDSGVSTTSVLVKNSSSSRVVGVEESITAGPRNFNGVSDGSTGAGVGQGAAEHESSTGGAKRKSSSSNYSKKSRTIFAGRSLPRNQNVRVNDKISFPTY